MPNVHVLFKVRSSLFADLDGLDAFFLNPLNEFKNVIYLYFELYGL